MSGFLRLLCGLPILLILAACEPVSDSERAYFEAREQDRQQQETFRQALEDGTGSDEAIEAVKKHTAPDDSGTVAEWIDRERLQLRGEVMFPRWEARRTAPNRYEVRYTFTYRDDDLSIERKGYSWEVDTMIDVVGTMTELLPEEMDGRSRRMMEQQERLDQLRDEFSLE